MTPNAEWDGILREGEVILWQGKPDPGFYIHPSRRKTFTGGLICLAAGMLFVGGAAWIGVALMVLFGLFFVIFGAALLYQGGLRPTYLRRHSFYTLTDQRAIIGIALPGNAPTLKTYEITRDGAFDFVPGRLGSVVFDYESGGVEINDEPQLYAVGFMRFEGAEEVWQMVQSIQSARQSEDA